MEALPVIRIRETLFMRQCRSNMIFFFFLPSSQYLNESRVAITALLTLLDLLLLVSCVLINHIIISNHVASYGNSNYYILDNVLFNDNILLLSLIVQLKYNCIG